MSRQNKTIGLDIGGTKILMEVFDGNFKVLHRIKVPTELKKGEEGLIEQIYSLIDRYFDKSVTGIGVAVPGIVDIYKGILVKAPHLPAKKNCPLRKLLKSRYKVPVRVDNDINAFLAAESKSKKLNKYINLVAVMAGTGVGGAIMINGKLVYGKNGYAGEVGHMVIKQDGKLKSFEQNVSGFFIPQIARELGIKKKMTAYDLTGKTPESRKIIAYITKQLGIGLANLNLIFNPEVFVLGGSIYNLFLSDKKKEIAEIIKKSSLDGSCPKLITAGKKTSVAEGAVRLLADE